MDEQLTRVAARLGEALRARQLTIATAESCTGGWVAKALTDIAGSSAWFVCGYVSYSNRAKQQMLGVPARLIEHQGAVSEAVVAEMVRGAITHSGANLALAVSGIAGPGGGTPDKPVGTVWFGWGRSGSEVITRMEQFDGDRERVRHQAVLTALRGALKLVER